MSDMSLADEISAALGDIVEILEKRPADQLRGVLDEFCASMADVVSAIEKSGQSDAIEKLGDVIAKLKLNPSIQVEAPAVNVNVSPTPIVVESPVVKFEVPQGGGWAFDVEYEDGRVKRMLAKRT